MTRPQELRALWLMALLPLLLQPALVRAEDAADAAIERAEAWVEREPTSVSARCELAEAYLTKYRATGDKGSILFAAATAEQAIELDGESARAQSTLARIYQAQGRSEAAIRHAEKAKEIQPGHPEASRVSRERGLPAAPPRATPPQPVPAAPGPTTTATPPPTEPVRTTPPPPPTRPTPPARTVTPTPPPARPAPPPRTVTPSPPPPSPTAPRATTPSPPARATPSPPPRAPTRAPSGSGGSAVPGGPGAVPPWVLILGAVLAIGIVALVVQLARLMRLRSLGARLEIPGHSPVELTMFTTTIGRGEGNRLQLDDPEVSTAHAVVRFTGGGLRIFDLGSRNGLTVNGRKVVEKTLRRGDEVVLGNTTLLFQSAAESEANR